MTSLNNEEIETIKNIRVLYFENDYLTLKFVKKCLYNYFDKIDSCIEPTTILDNINYDDYDLVITDIDMPGINGIGLIKEIKNKKPNMNFIIITAHSDMKYLIESRRLNISGYIKKPMILSEFENILLGIIKKNKKNKSFDIGPMLYNDDYIVEID